MCTLSSVLLSVHLICPSIVVESAKSSKCRRFLLPRLGIYFQSPDWYIFVAAYIRIWQLVTSFKAISGWFLKTLGYSFHVFQEKGYDRVMVQQPIILCSAAIFFTVCFGDATLLFLAIQLFCSFSNHLWFF